MIEVRNAVKRYRDHLAVDGVSFRAHPGEIFGLLGPNGAGKTTIIRMIMNILTPDSGEVLFDGGPVAERDWIYLCCVTLLDLKRMTVLYS